MTASEATPTPKYNLPPKLEGLLASLSAYYARKGKTLLQRVLVNATYSVDTAWCEYDRESGREGWAHVIHLCVPANLFVDAMDNLTEIEKAICADLDRISKCPNEWISAVTIEPTETSDILRWREESGALLTIQKSEKEMKDAAERLWTKGYLRAFLSHKAECKKEASALKVSLMVVGVSAFVAHEDIEPTKEWQDEIELALSTQDVCVALLTEKFRNSNWTDQEIGMSIGRGVPIVSVRLGHDPYGFIGKFQAVAGMGKKSEEIADELVRAFIGNQRISQRMASALVLSFEKARRFVAANRLMYHLEALSSLSPDLIRRLENAPKQNPNVECAYVVRNRLPNVISRLRGKRRITE